MQVIKYYFFGFFIIFLIKCGFSLPIALFFLNFNNVRILKIYLNIVSKV